MVKKNTEKNEVPFIPEWALYENGRAEFRKSLKDAAEFFKRIDEEKSSTRFKPDASIIVRIESRRKKKT